MVARTWHCLRHAADGLPVAVQKLAQHRILSAPVLIAPDVEDVGDLAAEAPRSQLLGWVDVNDIVREFVKSALRPDLFARVRISACELALDLCARLCATTCRRVCNNAACARLGAEQAHIRLRSSKQALVFVAVEHKVEGKTSMLMMISEVFSLSA